MVGVTVGVGVAVGVDAAVVVVVGGIGWWKKQENMNFRIPSKYPNRPDPWQLSWAETKLATTNSRSIVESFILKYFDVAL